MWTYAQDCLNLTPEPDYLILADECNDYYYNIPLVEVTPDEKSQQKTCHVLNPGNFSYDRSFVVIYPYNDTVSLSKVEV